MQMGSKRKLEQQSSLSDKIDLKVKITRDKEGHYIMSKGSIQGKCITTLNIYVPSVREPQYIRQMLIGIKGGNC